MTDSHSLIARWARTVNDVEHEYALTLDDYLNDLDVRHALGKLPSVALELRMLDERFRAATFPSGACVWGEENEAAEGWDREAHWYYWRLPRHAGPAFHES